LGWLTFYLLWISDEKKTSKEVQEYIDDNWDALQQEAEEG